MGYPQNHINLSYNIMGIPVSKYIGYRMIED